MKKGSVLSQIVKEISLANFADETPLTTKVDQTIKLAIPGDVYDWFMKEVCPPNFSGSQGLKLIKWLFSDIKRAKLDLKHIGLIRRARREQFIDFVIENLPTPAVMANTTKEHLEAYKFDSDMLEILIPYLAKVVKRDEPTVQVALRWAMVGKLINDDDCRWMLRYCKPVSEYEQLLLI
jgi:hypothetical protein